MGCTAARPQPVLATAASRQRVPPSTPPKRNDLSDVLSAATTPIQPVSDVYSLVVAASSPSKVDPHKPTTTGVALEYIKSLVSKSPTDTLVSEFFGDHDEFCARLSQNPSSTHFLNKTADYFVVYPSNCTISSLVQALSEIPESPVFLWVDGKSTLTNGSDRSAQYFESLMEVYKQIGKGIVVASPWNEPSPLPAIRCLEMYFAKMSGCTVLVAASKKECDEFIREMREKPLGPTRFHIVLDHEVEDTSSSTPVSELIRENFGEIRSSIASLFQSLVNRLAEEMLMKTGDEEERRAVALASRASLHYACRELDDSKRRFEEALALLMKARNSPLAASVLHNIAKIYEDQGNVAEALELYERCIAMEEPVSRISVNLSSQGGEVLRTPSNQNLKQALKEKRGGFWRDSFTIPSPHDIGSATTIFNVACVLARRQEWEKAEKLFQESLAARQACAPGGESLDVAWCLNSMGVFYEQIGRHELAVQSYQKALALRRKLQAGEALVSESLENLGGYLLSRGQREESKSLLDESLALRVKYFGLDSDQVAHTLIALARWWKDQDSAKATKLVHEALEIFRSCEEAENIVDELRNEFNIGDCT